MMRLNLILPMMLMFPLSAAAQDGFSWVTDPVFEDAGSAQDGVVPLKQGGVWGLMGRNGAWVVPPQFQSMGAQSDGLFAARLNGLWGVVDAAGTEVVPFRFDGLGTPGLLTPVLADGRWQILDYRGEILPEPLAFDTLVGNSGPCFSGTSGGQPVVDWRGTEPRVTVLDTVASLSAPTGDMVPAELPDGRVALLFCSNPYVNETTEALEDVRSLSNNMIAVKRGGLWGFDPSGVYHLEQIAPQFAAVRDFSEGLAPVQGDGGKWGYVNRRGEMVIAPQFDAAYGHSDGIAGVRMGDLRGAIDRAGNMVVAPQFGDFWRHGGGVMPVQKGEGWGVIALEASDPATAFDLPLADVTARLAARKPLISIVPSTPHFYLGQDIQSRHDIGFSADSRVMLTALTGDGFAGSGEVALWDRDSNKLIRKIRVDGLTQAAMAGEILVAATMDGDILLMDATNGAELHRDKMFDGPVNSLVVSADGAHLAAIGAGLVQVWTMADGAQVLRARASEAKVAFATDGQSLWLGGTDGTLRRVGLDGQVLLRVPGPVKVPPSQRFGTSLGWHNPDMALSPAGILVRALYDFAQQADGSFLQVTRLELTTPEGVRGLELPEGLSSVMSVDVSDDGGKVMLGGLQDADWSARWLVIDVGTGASLSDVTQVQSLGWVDRMRFTPEGRVILVAGEGASIREVEVNGDQIAVYGAPLDVAVGSLAFPDRTDVFVTNGDGRVIRWDMALGQLAQTVETGVGSGSETLFASDGQILGILDGYDENSLAAIDIATFAPVDASRASALYETAVIDGFGKRIAVDDITQARLDSVQGLGEFVVPVPMAGGRFGLVTETVGEHRLYDLATGELAATFLASPDGEWLVLTPEGFFAASENGAKLVSVSNGLRSFAVDQVFQALYRPDLVQAKLAGDPDGVVAAAAAELDLTAVLGSGPAPRIKLAFPVPGMRAEGELIDAGVELTDEGGGIGRVEWRVNGVTADITTRAAEALGADDTLTAQLALEPGRNVIEVLAYNSAGLIASVPQTVVIDWDGLGSGTAPALHVLAIGVNDYADGRLRLTYAAADAKAFGAAVAKAGAGLFSSVNVVTLLDGQVTDAGLEAAFADLSAVVKPSDVFVFFLAGHGKTVEGEYHFIPADFSFAGEDPVRRNGIRQERWQEWMAGIKAKKSVMIYDTCESGSATGTRSLDAALSQSAAVERLTRAMGRTILSASTDDAPALEGYQGHGVLTYALLSALQSGDANGNATIEVTELAAFIDQAVPEFSVSAFGYRQVPQMSIKGSDFALGAQVSVLAEAAESFPATLTHVVAGGTGVLDAPGGAAVQTIEAGVFFGVFLIEEKDGFARVAKDGKALGWVPVASLGKLQ